MQTSIGDGEHETYSVHWVRAGLPLRALTGHFGVETHTKNGWLSWTVPELLGQAAPPPLRPIWPGFAVNTLAFGSVVFLAWSAPGAIRRRMRGRRGSCVRCGYDLGGISGPCPECGPQGGA